MVVYQPQRLAALEEHVTVERVAPDCWIARRTRAVHAHLEGLAVVPLQRLQPSHDDKVRRLLVLHAAVANGPIGQRVAYHAPLVEIVLVDGRLGRTAFVVVVAVVPGHVNAQIGLVGAQIARHLLEPALDVRADEVEDPRDRGDDLLCDVIIRVQPK